MNHFIALIISSLLGAVISYFSLTLWANNMFDPNASFFYKNSYIFTVLGLLFAWLMTYLAIQFNSLVASKFLYLTSFMGYLLGIVLAYVVLFVIIKI